MNVSVIIPTWNGERYLGAALESVYAQTTQPLEVIVVDDESTDNTAVVARAYPVHLELCTHQGAATARNTGVSLARGEFIALLDHDDLWLPEKLEIQLSAFAQDPLLGVVFTAVEQFISPDTPEIKNEVLFAPGVQILPITSALMARREVFAAAGLFPLLHSGDTMLWLARVQQLGIGVQILNRCLVKRRIHQSNMTRRQKDEVQQGYFKALRQWLLEKRSRET
jgi:glycosyltransferase involved in cell wall biosynthesis